MIGDIYDSYKNWNKQEKRPVLAVMKGPSMVRLDAPSLSADGITYLQQHCRILDGQYGALRPLDAIQSFRCPLETKLTVDNQSLHDFWKDDVAKELRSMEGDFVLNIASNEYAKLAKDLRKDDVPFVDVKFVTGGKSASVYGKQGRGALLRFCSEKRVQTLEDVKQFDYDGYSLDEGESSDTNLVFHRSSAPKKKKN